MTRQLLAVIIYAAGLALMWSFSLRSSLVYGWDIADEYHSMHQTVVTGIWHTAHPGDAYGAMLAVTVLPAELHSLSGVQALLVFKVVYPADRRAVPGGGLRPSAPGPRAPLGLYSSGVRRHASYLLPAASGSGETRDRHGPVRRADRGRAGQSSSHGGRNGLWSACSAWAWCVSHYSTAYLAIPLLGHYSGSAMGTLLVPAIPRVTGSVLVAFAVALAGALMWYGPVTHMGSNLVQFAGTARSQGIDFLPNKSGNPLFTYLQGESSQQLEPAQYEQFAHEYYEAHDPFVTPLPDAGDPQYALHPAPPLSVPPVKWTLGSKMLNLIDLLVQQLTNLLAGIGVLMIVMRRDATVVTRQVGLVGLAALVLLTLSRVSGTVAQAYSPERAYLQTMIVLAITLCWPIQCLLWRWRRLQPVVLSASLVSLTAFLVGSASLTGALLGGGTATNLANSGVDYEWFYMTTPEIASAAWLVKAAPPGQLLYGDEYGELRLVAVGGDRPAMFDDITPLTIDQHAWVYASQTNIVDKTTYSSLSPYSASYAFPIRFLDLNYDTVYTDGSSEVFHR